MVSRDLRIAALLFADDVVPLSSSDFDLQHAPSQFAFECEAQEHLQGFLPECGGLLPLDWD